MIVRIVRMEFVPEKLPEFLTIFHNTKAKIRAFDGCSRLELHVDAQNPSIRYTYSVWDSENALEKYRNSALFQSTWASTKVLFAAKPLAYSLMLAEAVI